MIEPTQRSNYAGLMGPEYLAIILTDVANECRKLWAFSAAAIHHEPEFEWTLKTKSKPEFKEHIASGAGKLTTTGEAPDIEPLPGNIEVKGQVVYPNKAREEAGLPVAKVTAGPDGSMSDFAEGIDPLSESAKVIERLTKGM